jgi:hypothetical protein
LGQLDISNWKDVEAKNNASRVDPAIRPIVSLLNARGYKTFSSCSGGHRANLRRRYDRHESGYIAFSPPSRIPFLLYVALREKNQDFMLEAEAVIHDGNGDRRETLYTQLDWQLLDQKKPKLEYYQNFFTEMQRLVESMPEQSSDHEDVLKGLLGRRHLSLARRIVNGQAKRFTR